MVFGSRQISIILVIMLIVTIIPIITIPTISGDLLDTSALKSHGIIHINGNSQFTSSNGVISGAGSKNNPYIIENWSIDAKGTNHGIWIENTNSYFVIRNCFIYNATDRYRCGIFLRNTRNGGVENNRIASNYYGIQLYNSDYNLISNTTCNSNSNDGILLRYSDLNIVSNTTCYSNTDDGIFIYYSDNNQLFSNTCKLNGDMGIYLQFSELNEITDNICSNNALDGIHNSDSNSKMITNNKCDSNNGAGIVIIDDSDYSYIINNKCNSNNGTGIIVKDDSDNAKLTNNICNKNNHAGIFTGGNYHTTENNTCISNGDDGINLWNANFNYIMNNTCLLNDNGISIGGDSNTVLNNNCSSNKDDGISIDGESNIIKDNECESNANDGISIKDSDNNIISSNTCNSNDNNGIALKWGSDNNNIIKNDCTSKLNGIVLEYTINNTLQGNTMESCGIFLRGSSLNQWNMHNIDLTNTVNDRPVIYWKNRQGGLVPAGAGEVILANCQNIELTSQDLSRSSIGLLLGFTSETTVSKTIYSKNNFYGIYFYYSFNNVIDNCSFFSNSEYDLFFEDNSKNNIAINTTFDTIDFHDNTCELIYKNYLHLQVNNLDNKPLSGVDIQVKDNDTIVYSTPGFGGINQRTDSAGQIKWIRATDRIYESSPNPTKNITTISTKFVNSISFSNNQEIDMSTSHLEYLRIDLLPSQVKLKTPVDNSIINDSTPSMAWYESIDEDSELLTYNLQLTELGDVWDIKSTSNLIGLETINWNFTSQLSDGDFQWRVCANDGIGNGSWSDVWNFTLDTIEPISEISLPVNNGHYNSMNMVTGLATDPSSGTGVYQVQIYIKRLTDNFYWTGQTWSPEISWLTVSGTVNWFYSAGGIHWESNSFYNIRSRAIDNALNYERPNKGVTFFYDVEPPNLKIIINNDDTYTNSTSVILSLQAGDFNPESLRMAFSRNGHTWSSWEPFTNERQYTLSTNDGEKVVYFRVVDQTGNVAEPVFDAIILDSTPPENVSIVINGNDMYTNSRNVTLNLKAIDRLSGISNISIIYDKTWTSWETFSGTKNIQLPLIDGEKNVYFKVRDHAGNVAEPVFDKILLDTRPPENVSIEINENAKFTNSLEVVLDIFATDSLSGPDNIALSYDTSAWTNWETYKRTKLYSLLLGDGEKIIYLRVQDKAGNIAEYVFDTIILDTEPPQALSIAIEESTSGTDVKSVYLILNAEDDLSGLNQMSFSLDGMTWSEWKSYSQKISFIPPVNNGEITIYFRVSDNAGNIANPVSTTSIKQEKHPVDRSSNEIGYWVIAVGLVLILAIILAILFLIILKRRKQKSMGGQGDLGKSDKLKSIITSQVKTVSTHNTPAVKLPQNTQNVAYQQPSIRKEIPITNDRNLKHD